MIKAGNTSRALFPNVGSMPVFFPDKTCELEGTWEEGETELDIFLDKSFLLEVFSHAFDCYFWELE